MFGFRGLRVGGLKVPTISQLEGLGRGYWDMEGLGRE